jgi:hypothetical protein
LLPVGEFAYKGRTLQFTRDYLTELARSFRDKAFPAVPFQLADAKNTHTNDPERTRGMIEDVEIQDDGLYVVLSATDEGDKVLRDNPNLGVSARIYEDYERSDGKHWGAALQHVLGTLDPHIPDMKPWTAVAALAGETPEDVIDLSDTQYESSEGGRTVDKEALRKLLKAVRDGGSELTDSEIDELVDDDSEDEELSDEELDAIIADADAEFSDGDATDDTATIAASQQRRALELANQARYDQQALELAAVTARLDAQSYENERMRLVGAGIPKKCVELARPLLEGSAHIVELAGGDEIDAGQVMRNVLVEFSKQIKVLDLSGLIGRGDVPDDEEVEAANREVEERNAFVKAERERLGI